MENLRIQQLLKAGESRAVEFKASRNALNRDIYETVCAFLNGEGGDILLGVADDGTIVGVDPEYLAQMRRDFANAINNPQIINPPCYLGVEEVDCDGATLLHILVPPSSQVHRCKSRIYFRNEDGDFDITDEQDRVSRLYLNKQSHYSENTIYPYAELADLRPDLIARARKMSASIQRNHPWVGMDDAELLSSARLFQRDYQRGTEGLTLAAILLFGKDTTILSVLPHHKTDAILRRFNVDRYDDRDDIRTNLFESHDRLTAFGEKHLNDPFFLDGIQRVSARSHILREIVGNMLIHREYSHAFPAKLVIERACLYAENSNRPHGHGPIDPRLFSPYPKNPIIARVFKETGLADELGSGVRKLFKFGKAFAGHDPVLMEDDVFRVSLPIAEVVGEETDAGLVDGLVVGTEKGRSSVESTEKSSEKGRSSVESTEKSSEKGRSSVESTEKSSEKGRSSVESTEKSSDEKLPLTPRATKNTAEAILTLAEGNPQITVFQLSQKLGRSTSAINKQISRLKKNGQLVRVGPDKGGSWSVTR